MANLKQFLDVAAFSGVLMMSCMNVIAQSGEGLEQDRPALMAKGRARLNQDMPEKRLNLMTRNLGLTMEQQKKIRPILQEEAAQIETLRGDDTYNREERRSRLQKLNESTYEKIKPVLTPEQQKKHEVARQVIMENRTRQRDTKAGPKMTDNDPDSRLARLTQDLGLSKEQQEKIRPVLLDEFAQLEKLPGNDVLNREQRRLKLQQLNDETYNKVKPFLTSEQKKKYDEIMKKISDRRSLKKSGIGQNQAID